jgi:hypothetical protein
MKKLAEFRVHHMANKVSDVSTVGDQNYDTDHQDMSKPACQEAMDKPTEARAAQCDGFVPWATVKSQLDPLLDMLEATVAAAAEAAAVMGVSGAADGDDLAAGTAVVLTDMSAANVALNGQRAVVVRRLVKMKIEAYEVRMTPGATTSLRSGYQIQDHHRSLTHLLHTGASGARWSQQEGQAVQLAVCGGGCRRGCVDCHARGGSAFPSHTKI